VLAGSSYSSRLQILFWIALGNFIFPTAFTIIILVLYFHDSNYMHFLMLLISNAYVEIIGVLLATVWATSASWDDEQSPVATVQLTRMSFAKPSSSTANGGDSLVVHTVKSTVYDSDVEGGDGRKMDSLAGFSVELGENH
jgi:hypothetical protein